MVGSSHVGPPLCIGVGHPLVRCQGRSCPPSFDSLPPRHPRSRVVETKPKRHGGRDVPYGRHETERPTAGKWTCPAEEFVPFFPDFQGDLPPFPLRVEGRMFHMFRPFRPLPRRGTSMISVGYPLRASCDVSPPMGRESTRTHRCGSLSRIPGFPFLRFLLNRNRLLSFLRTTIPPPRCPPFTLLLPSGPLHPHERETDTQTHE